MCQIHSHPLLGKDTPCCFLVGYPVLQCLFFVLLLVKTENLSKRKSRPVQTSMKSVRDLPSESKVKLERKERRNEASPEVMKVFFFTVKAPDEPKLLEKIK